MSQHYDLEQQEQLANIKAFWEKWGTLISGLAFAIVLALAGWNGWNYWQNRKATEASVLLDQVNAAVDKKDSDAATRNLAILRKDYSKTAQADQAALRTARLLVDQKNWSGAEEVLDWINTNAKDEGIKALAVLHKSAVLIEQDKLDDALAALQKYSFPFEFRPLANDRRGDILKTQGKDAEAIEAYNQAFDGFDEFSSYRSLVEIKLNALGQSPKTLSSKPAA